MGWNINDAPVLRWTPTGVVANKYFFIQGAAYAALYQSAGSSNILQWNNETAIKI